MISGGDFEMYAEAEEASDELSVTPMMKVAPPSGMSYIATMSAALEPSLSSRHYSGAKLVSMA